MIPQDFIYDFSLAAYLILLLPFFFILFLGLFFYRRKILSQLASSHLRKRLIIPREDWIFWSKVAALGLAWTCATIALMQPKGNVHYPKELGDVSKVESILRLKAHDVIFLVDASASMSIQDGRTGQSRLHQAKEIADETISLLEGESASLFAFTSHLTKMSPSTTDYLFLRIMLQGLQIDEGGIPGTDFFTSLSELPQSSQDKLKTVIIFSDGGDTKLASLPESSQQDYIQSIVNLFKDQYNLRVYTIGIGKNQKEIIPEVKFKGQPVLSALDDRILLALATTNSGRFYKSEDASAIQISRDIAAHMHSERSLFIEGPSIEANMSQKLLYDLYFQIPLGLAIIFLSYVLLFPENFRSKYLLFILTLLSPIESNYAEDVREANIYAEAGVTDEALEIYKKLFEQTNVSWEKNYLQYNMGVIYLKKGDWQKAIDTFQSIELQNDPLLTVYLKKNLAISYYWKAITSTPDSTSEYLQIIYQLRDSLQQITFAKQADCILQKLEGNQNCTLNEDLKDFRYIVNQALASTLDAYRSYRMEHLNLRDGIPELLYSLSLLKENSLFMQQPDLPKNLQSSYRNYFYEMSSEWVTLWTTTKSLVNSEQQKVFEKSYNQFSEAINALQLGEYKKSVLLAEDAENGILEILKKLWENSIPQEILQRLIDVYQQVSVRETLPESLLIKLQTQQKQLSSFLTFENLSLKESIDRSTHLLDQSLQYLQQSQPFLARLFFEEAYQIIKQLLPKEPLLEEQALQMAIDTQEHALLINRLLIQSKETSQEGLLLVIEAQQETLKQAKNFLFSVYQVQVEDYKNGFCQKKPWDVFLPNFNLGYLSAAEAHKSLKISPKQAISKQEETLLYWKQLKSMMEHKKTAPEIEKNKEEEIPQVLQLLQEMSNDDQIKKKTSTSTKQQVERPW